MSASKGVTRAAGAGRYKPYPAYKDPGVEWPGAVPSHWTESKVKFLGRYINGYPFKPDDWDVDGRPILRIQNLTNRDAPFNRFPGDIDPRYRVTRGDILISWSASLGLFMWSEPEDAWLNQHIFKVVLREGFVDRSYFIWLGDWFIRELQKETHGSTMTHLTYGMFGGFRVDLPPAEEQRAIAAFLVRETARIDALVAKKERLIELLQEQRTALITRAVTRGLDPTVPVSNTESIVFPQIPAGWELRKLRRVLSRVKRPITVDPDSEYREIGIRSWGKGIFHKDAVRGALLEDKSVFSIAPGDFVLNIVFAWEGAVAVATEAERGMVGSHRFPTFRCSQDVDLDYLLMVFQTEHGRTLMEVNSPGAAGRNKTIRVDQFLDEVVPLPGVAEQREIVRRFRSDEALLGGLLGRLRDAIARLKELRTALISAAVTGKIDVREDVA